MVTITVMIGARAARNSRRKFRFSRGVSHAVGETCPFSRPAPTPRQVKPVQRDEFGKPISEAEAKEGPPVVEVGGVAVPVTRHQDYPSRGDGESGGGDSETSLRDAVLSTNLAIC